MYTGGTPQAIEFIKKYKKAGYIVDFYSDEHIKTLDEDYGPITTDDLKIFDEKYGTAYRGHMLAIYLGDENHELLNELSSLYLPFQRLFQHTTTFGGWTHKPDFLLVNLATTEVLCVGLGRKNRSFHFELHRHLKIFSPNEAVSKGSKNFDVNNSSDCSEKFFELDHHRIAKRVISEAQYLGTHYFEYDHIPGNSDVMVTLNEDDGLYYFDDYDDEEGMTEEQVKEIQEEYENRKEWIDDCIKSLQEIFPKLDTWDLNTGDY